MPYEIRPVREDELLSYVECLSTGFLDRPDVARVAAEVGELWELGTAWAAIDGGRVCGTFRWFTTELTTPGCARLPAAGVAAVTVLPTHRRRGILRAMAGAAHEAMREGGQAIALLHASEYPIYGHVGYGPGSATTSWSLDALSTGFMGRPAGSVELVEIDGAARAAIVDVFDAWRKRQPGEISRRDYRWDFDLGLREGAWEKRWKGFLVLHRDAAGDVDGYARYRAEEKWEHGQPRGVVTLDDLHALDPDAYAALWRFLAEIDLVATVKAEGRPLDERLPWLLTNARAAVQAERGDSLWVRLLDLPRALEARAYEREASLVIEVVEPRPSGVGTGAGRPQRLALEAGPGGARCRRTNRSPDLTLGVAALGAAYLGGVRLRDAVLAFGGVDEHRAGSLLAAEAALRTLDPPWCSTFF